MCLCKLLRIPSNAVSKTSLQSVEIRMKSKLIAYLVASALKDLTGLAAGCCNICFGSSIQTLCVNICHSLITYQMVLSCI